jgi:hypothetical protein
MTLETKVTGIGMPWSVDFQASIVPVNFRSIASYPVEVIMTAGPAAGRIGRIVAGGAIFGIIARFGPVFRSPGRR